jgi:hypothetical protein
MDNSKTFRSQELQSLCAKWKVRLTYRCAYRPSGNGIIERNHRTIKRMAARTGEDALDMVYWYNSAPKEGVDKETVPSAGIFKYEWRYPDTPQAQVEKRPASSGLVFEIGERVVVKPERARCTTEWTEGTITGMGEGVAVEVNGVPRHLADIRRLEGRREERTRGTDESSQRLDETNLERPRRERRKPEWYR